MEVCLVCELLLFIYLVYWWLVQANLQCLSPVRRANRDQRREPKRRLCNRNAIYVHRAVVHMQVVVARPRPGQAMAFP